ncbi:MAG: alanine:cation symporter family protein [Bdellovibrionaceae bacterium]|nr:alanine:cation symporter family protein [Pseudobdellovibrionaceae bacterium]
METAKMLSQILSIVVDYAWGMPLLILLVGGGITLVFYSRFIPLVGFVHAIKLVTGKFHHKDEEKAEGQLSHFKALMNALSSTIGLGNIAGVAVAITQGGPGAIFWMWVSALIGMNTKFFESTLAVMYRGHDYRGEVQGGPMYVIEKALPKQFHFLAIFFAVCGLIGTMSLFQVNQLASMSETYFSVPPIFVGIVSSVFVAYVAMGGVRRIAEITSRLVPLMCVLYIISAISILVLKSDLIPRVFLSIFTEALSPSAVGGGVFAGILIVMKVGIKRASFSNEAGIGTASMAHSNAKTSEPISEGLVAMLGPFIDTIVVCTMTALVILVTLDPSSYGTDSGVVLTTRAFESVFGVLGRYFLGISVVLFSLTTMVGMSNYNEKCWNYLFKGRSFFKENSFIAFYAITILFGAVSASDDVVNLLDIGFAFMAIPNMMATIYLAPKVKVELLKYKAKYLS